MSWQDKQIDQLHQSSLAEPDAFYWPGYMWLWLDHLKEEDLLRQLEAFRKMGARSIWILPLEKSWRTYRLPTDMEPDYLTKPFEALLQKTIAAAKKLGMRVWLNDEPGYPSGGDIGRIVKARPELIVKKLVQQQIPLRSGESFTVPACIAAFTDEKDDSMSRLHPDETFTALNDTVITLYCAVKDTSAETPNYTDLLNPETAPQFIQNCYEYLKALAGSYFGDTVPIIFFDEPAVHVPPWTDDLVESFAAEKGYDICERIWQLFDPERTDNLVRVDYFDWWTRRLADHFFGPVQAWCQKNNVLFTGHFGGDDYTMGNSNHGYGHIMRLLRKADIPCVDAIWRQIWPGMRELCDSRTEAPNHHFPKYASSVAHQEDRTWSGTESFAVYGSGLSLDNMKWITDYQYVRGINLMTLSNAVSSSRDYFMGRIRPTFLPLEASPLNAYMDLYHTYTARLSYLLSRGRPLLDTALYFPVRDVWAGGQKAIAAAAAHDELAETLLRLQCDFDLIDDDVLGDPATVIQSGCLRAGPMRYRTVYIARCAWLTSEARAKLAAFSAAGGQLIWVGPDEDVAKPDGAQTVSHDSLTDVVRPLVKASPPEPQLRVCVRELDGGRLYFLSNEATTPLACTVTFAEDQPLYRLDAETAQVWQPKAASKQAEGWQLPLNLPFAGSCFVYFAAEPGPLVAEPALAGSVLRTLAEGWQLKTAMSYRLGEHHFLVEPGSDNWQPVSLGDWTGKLDPAFSGDVQYRLLFDCTLEEAASAALLDLGDVHFACTVRLNGQEIGRKAWGPYHFHVAGLLRQGENELLVTVSNSMANQFIHTSGLDRWPDNVMGPYHKIAKRFEKEDVARGSGLFGPVCLLGQKQEHATARQIKPADKGRIQECHKKTH